MQCQIYTCISAKDTKSRTNSGFLLLHVSLSNANVRSRVAATFTKAKCGHLRSRSGSQMEYKLKRSFQHVPLQGDLKPF